MPLLSGCAYVNPFGQMLPDAPAAQDAGALAPMQGDHLFGDVIGSIETALMRIFGGGALWSTRMDSFNATLHTIWVGLGNVDLGHGALPLS